MIRKKQGAHLPHWTKPDGIYNVTFRLADSVPQAKLETWRWERESIVEHAKRQNRPLTRDERDALAKLHTDNIEHFLRSGHGACWLRRDDVAAAVIGAFKFFEDKRYRLYAWCVMPNHVHVIVRPFATVELSKILLSWKSFSAKEANRLLGRHGTFWGTEYYDHLISSDDELRSSIRYVWENPEKACLRDWPWRWKTEESNFPDNDYWGKQRL
jgi:REP element-mobilizing transposase RayT